MSHKKVTDLGSWYSHFDASRMEQGKFYQLRGWSAVTLETYNGDTCITLYSYDACIVRYNVAEHAFHAVQFERPRDVSTTTTRHLREFETFVRRLHGFDDVPVCDGPVTYDYPLSHTPNSWAFRGWSGDYDSKPFWW